uniref:Uncharacterized protein n=1 Tax=Oryza sativa subsp. japonica TaxID=39947 RepID=Q6ZDP7_ORYSJ|nr:hypothetical protein [Oryza sativa Japonica Group]BAD30386.1 hypothetical protein [Oryza sativa Japonica Group]
MEGNGGREEGDGGKGDGKNARRERDQSEGEEAAYGARTVALVHVSRSANVSHG